jgi:hypothetical protein
MTRSMMERILLICLLNSFSVEQLAVRGFPDGGEHVVSGVSFFADPVGVVECDENAGFVEAVRVVPAALNRIRVASAMLEVVADMLIRTEIINEHRSGGEIVVTESFGYKDIVKVLRVAGEIPGDDVPRDFIARTIDFVADAYASPFLQLDIGVFLRVTPEECYRRIIAQRGGVGAVEDMGFAGRTGRSSFMELQSALLAEFEEMAAKWGWHIAEVNDATPEEALDTVAGIILTKVTPAQHEAEL